jgi:hypothetical protein
MSIFALAGAFEDIVHALAIIESNERIAQIGDGGRAFGLLQQHPSFFAEYYGRSLLFPSSVSHTWEEAEVVAAATYFGRYIEILGQDGAVSAYNTGVKAFNDGQRNEVYIARWGNAFQDVRSGNHKCRIS